MTQRNTSLAAYLAMLLLLVLAGCTTEERIVDGTRAYERKQYAVAIPMLEKEYNATASNIERGNLAYMLAESYRIINKPEQARDWYLNAYDAGKGADALRRYAYTLKELEEYKDAERAFRDLGIEIGDPYAYQREIIACKQASTWAQNPQNEHTDLNPVRSNSAAADYNAVPYQQHYLVISSDREGSTGDKLYKWTGLSFSDLWLLDERSGEVTNFSEVLNTPFNESSITFNNSYTQAIFTRCGQAGKTEIDYCQLYYTERTGDSWSEPQALTITQEEVNYSHPFLTPDGKTLYFSSDMPQGLGGYDIYRSTRQMDGTWSFPENLGSAINTEGNEVTPFMDADTLYFSSDFHVGMGGADIFRTERMGDNWGPLQNLRAPVNSGADDFGYRVDRRRPYEPGVVKRGYFSTNRKGGRGNDDLMQFTQRVPPPPVDVDTLPSDIDTIEEPPIVYQMILKGTVVEEIYNIENDPNSGVARKSPLANASVQVAYGDTTFRVQTNPEGAFELTLEEQTAYVFTASQDDYLTQEQRFSTRGIENDPNNPIQVFYLEIPLSRIIRNVEITLEGIYYDFDQSYIRPDARPILNELATLLQRNPSINIELASHTDCRGSDAYNQRLSQARAAAAVEYLVSKGINASRLTARGYGESVPVTTCACARCSEEENQRNRRTTFKIVE